MSAHGDSFKEILQLKYTTSSDICYADWIESNTFLKGKRYSFKDHEYQIGPVNDKSRVMVAHKCAQLGFTECFFRWMVAFLATHQGSQGIFTQPTATDMNSFVKSRADMILEDCTVLKKLGIGGVDNASLKRIGSAFLNLRGTFGARAAISVPSDVNIYDEVNFSNPHVLNLYKSRLQHSEFKYERYISTPTIPNYGVSELYNRSDKKRINCRCTHCNHHQFLSWPENIFFRRLADNQTIPYTFETMELFVASPWLYKAFFGCTSCQGELDRSWAHREWVAEYPERALDPETGVSGWFVSQLDAVHVTATDLVKASDKRLEGYKKIEDFYNFCLALPYEGGDSVKITDACKPFCILPMEEAQSSMGSFIGMDLGNICHIIVVKDLYVSGILRPVVVAALRISKDDLENDFPGIGKRFGRAFSISDAQPYTTTVEKLAKADSGRMLCCYFGGKKPYTVSEHLVTASKTQMLDEVTDYLPRGDVMLASGLKDLDIVWEHLKRLVKIKEEDEDGEVFYNYPKIGDDHYGLALGYALLAKKIFYEKGIADDGNCGEVCVTGMETSL